MADSDKARLVYTLICDDVRIEMGNKMSLMGIFQNVFLPQFPSTVVKFAILNHWEGECSSTSEIRIVTPSGAEAVRSQATGFKIARGGHADNVTFFTNVTFSEAGTYCVEVLLDGKVAGSVPLHLRLMEQNQGPRPVN